MNGSQRSKYLIIGADGLVGSHLARLCGSSKFIGTGYNLDVEGLIRMDLCDHQQVANIIDECRPEVIFHCANLAGGINYCEQNPEIARLFHYASTVNLGELCMNRGIWLVFISTEAIFPDLSGFVEEDDPPGPLNVYGDCKNRAEIWIKQHLEKFTIVRTVNVYGWDPDSKTPNYIMQLYNSLSAGQRFSAASFQKGTPTCVDDLARALLELVEKQMAGVFHVAGPERIDRYQWALQAASKLGLDSSLIDEIKVPPPLQVRRPDNLVLSTRRFTGACRTELHDVESGLELMRQRMEDDIRK